MRKLRFNNEVLGKDFSVIGKSMGDYFIKIDTSVIGDIIGLSDMGEADRDRELSSGRILDSLQHSLNGEKTHIQEGEYEILGKDMASDTLIVKIPAINTIKTTEGIIPFIKNNTKYFFGSENDDNVDSLLGTIRPGTAIVDDIEIDSTIRTAEEQAKLKEQEQVLSEEPGVIYNGYPRGTGKTSLMYSMMNQQIKLNKDHMERIMLATPNIPEDAHFFYKQEYDKPPIGNPPNWVHTDFRETPMERDNKIKEASNGG